MALKSYESVHLLDVAKTSEDSTTMNEKENHHSQPPTKKRRLNTGLSGQHQYRDIGFAPTVTPQSDLSGFSEAAWATDRQVARDSILSLIERLSQSADESLVPTLAKLKSAATDLLLAAVRTQAYKNTQLSRTGEPGLMRLPAEIRDMIWQYAIPEKLDCCYGGLVRHNEPNEPLVEPEENDIMFTHATRGRGLPINKQILEESSTVAEPTGFSCCSLRCFFSLDPKLIWPYDTSYDSTISGRWRSITRVRVLRSVFGDVQEMERQCDIINASLGNYTQKSPVKFKWVLRTSDEFYFIEKRPIATSEPALA